jgi:GR25 family glycosyltransferase involved in LPS biosynthesis
MLVHIICLDIALGSAITQQLLASLDHHGWHHKLHSACEGWQLTKEDWNRRGVELLPQSKIARQPGAQGCLWSHMDLWELCVLENQPMIILESDALCIAPPVELNSRQLLKIAYKFDITRPNKRTGQWSPGAVGYSLSPEHANTLLAHVKQTSALEVDKLIGSRIVDWAHGPRLFDINTKSYSRSSTKSINITDYERLLHNK